MTHAHLDHSGYLPVLRKSGFTGPVYCTSGTTALAHILKAAGAADIVTCNTIDLKAVLADGVRDLLETNTPRLAVQEKTT